MAVGVWGASGKIFWFLDEVEKHGSEVRVDLLRLGLDFDAAGTGHSTWGNLIAALEVSPSPSAYRVAVEGEKAHWTTSMELQALLIEHLDFLRWELAGSPSGKRPPRVPRPGVEDGSRTIGAGESWTPESFDEWWELQA